MRRQPGLHGWGIAAGFRDRHARRATHRAGSRAVSAADTGPEQVAGERATTPVARSVSMQSRLSNLLAVSLMTVLGLGTLIWYYANNASRQSRIRSNIQSAAANHAAGDTVLPSLGRIDAPLPPAVFREIESPPPIDAPPVSADDRMALTATTLP